MVLAHIWSDVGLAAPMQRTAMGQMMVFHRAHGLVPLASLAQLMLVEHWLDVLLESSCPKKSWDIE